MTLNLALAQIKCNIGEIENNQTNILNFIDKAAQSPVDILIFPEMATSGYGIEDKLLAPDYQRLLRKVNMAIVERSRKFPGLIIWGTAYPNGLLPASCFAEGVTHNLPELEYFARNWPGNEVVLESVEINSELGGAYADKTRLRRDICEKIEVEWPNYLDISQEVNLNSSSNAEASYRSQVLPNIAAIAGRKVLYNVALAAYNGEIIHLYAKVNLPNYGVFKESRYFSPGQWPVKPLEWRGYHFGLVICEDLWNNDYIDEYLLQFPHIQAILSLNASPYHLNKLEQRLNVLDSIAARWQKPIAYVNQVGAQNHLIFDGGSLLWQPEVDEKRLDVAIVQHDLMLQEKEISFFRENLLISEIQLFSFNNSSLPQNANTVQPSNHAHILAQNKILAQAQGDPNFKAAQLYQALMHGLRDYLSKAQVTSVLLGLSGGMDSALVAALAADALGPEKLLCVTLPSIYTSQDSYADAYYIVNNLGCAVQEISIEKLHYLAQQEVSAAITGLYMNEKLFAPPAVANITWENLQARLRGMLLMALANAGRRLLLATGNKSEMAMGYATLYGDMCGGLAPIADLYKTQVYALAAWRNLYIPEDALVRKTAIFPGNVFAKEPSAELKPGQIDRDTLPDYAILDKLLYYMIEKNLDNLEISKLLTIPLDMVIEIRHKLDNSEFKRRQACCPLKVSESCLGYDRTFPL